MPFWKRCGKMLTESKMGGFGGFGIFNEHCQAAAAATATAPCTIGSVRGFPRPEPLPLDLVVPLFFWRRLAYEQRAHDVRGRCSPKCQPSNRHRNAALVALSTTLERPTVHPAGCLAVLIAARQRVPRSSCRFGSGVARCSPSLVWTNWVPSTGIAKQQPCIILARIAHCMMANMAHGLPYATRALEQKSVAHREKRGMVSPTVNVLCARPDNTTTIVMLQHHVNIVQVADSRTQSELSNADQYHALPVVNTRVRVPPQ
jgi:hypothetical protein